MIMCRLAGVPQILYFWTKSLNFAQKYSIAKYEEIATMCCDGNNRAGFLFSVAYRILLACHYYKLFQNPTALF